MYLEKDFNIWRELQVSYTDIKVRRAKDSDIVLFEGKEYPRHAVKRWVLERDRIKVRVDALNKYPDDAMFYYQYGFCGDMIYFWSLNSSGYTTDISKAQLYTKEEAIKFAKSSRIDERIWEESVVKEGITSVVNYERIEKTTGDMRKEPRPDEVFIESIKNLVNGLLIENKNYKTGYYDSTWEMSAAIREQGEYIIEKIDDWKHLVEPFEEK